MSENSKIEWTDASWTPVRARRKDNGKVGVACVKVSPACKNCYAERFNMRNLPVHGTGLPYTVEALDQVEIFLDEEMLLVPLKWKKPRKIFVCSQTDLFGEFVPDEMIDRVFAVMALCPQHTFQVLTKRAATSN
jgi:protein gp37